MARLRNDITFKANPTLHRRGAAHALWGGRVGGITGRQNNVVRQSVERGEEACPNVPRGGEVGRGWGVDRSGRRWGVRLSLRLRPGDLDRPPCPGPPPGDVLRRGRCRSGSCDRAGGPASRRRESIGDPRTQPFPQSVPGDRPGLFIPFPRRHRSHRPCFASPRSGRQGRTFRYQTLRELIAGILMAVAGWNMLHLLEQLHLLGILQRRLPSQNTP